LRQEFFIIWCLFIFHANSLTLSPVDSLSLQVSGGAAISSLHGAGAKASENGLLICGLDHAINDRLHAICSVRGGRSSLQSFIEEADIRWAFGQNEADAGFLSQRYGFDALYRPYSLFNLLFDKPLLWDSYGFGLAYKRRMGRRFGLVAGSTIATRENGQAHVMLSMENDHLTSRLLGGFQSYSQENQDNSVSSGLELLYRWRWTELHGVAKYTHFLGFGHSANPTMIPGESIIGFLECRLTPVSPIQLSAMSYVLSTKKRYNHEFYFEGLELSWMFVTMFAVGCGCEWQKDDNVTSLMPRLFAKAVPSAGHAGLEISIQPTILRGEIASYRLSGELWIRL
jgi:hypothetical protein